MATLQTAINSAIAKEPLFAINDFKKTSMLTGVEAVVSRLLTLLYMEHGTIRDIYNMGVNIKQYLFERVVDAGSIEQEINFQLSTYFKSEYGNVTAQCFLSNEANSNGKTLNVIFNFSSPLDDKGRRKLTIKFDKERVIKNTSDIDIFIN